MLEFFEGLSVIGKVYWTTALIGSALLVVILIMTLMGGDMDGDMEADGTDFDADDGGVGFQFFTFKNLVAFFTIFGWTGISCLENGFSNGLTIIISTIAGLIMMALTSLLFYWMSKLAQSGTLKMKNAIGAIGEVYLPIGAKRSNIGKVQIKVQGSLRELEAITDSSETLSTTTIVKVVDIVSAELLLVEKV
ncbi:MAG: hypothetical protein P8H59_03280 [Flavobacteriales bacterium]|nr:hypothetical protein [Flavobacteriales bacterium]MDG1779947.1 hypothetical protein [Flavobacteriales bacterium]MDG2245735.1 hypothetical protein [Flavobacteriales bacterium]